MIINLSQPWTGVGTGNNIYNNNKADIRYKL